MKIQESKYQSSSYCKPSFIREHFYYRSVRKKIKGRKYVHFMYFAFKFRYKNGILTNIKHHELVPGIRIAKLKHREKKRVYSIPTLIVIDIYHNLQTILTVDFDSPINVYLVDVDLCHSVK